MAAAAASAPLSPELMITVEKMEEAESGGLYKMEIRERLDADKAEDKDLGAYSRFIVTLSWINIHQHWFSLSVKAKYLNEHQTQLQCLDVH